MSHESQLRDLLGREPELVEVLRDFLPSHRGDSVMRGDRLFVVRVEPDRLGIGVMTVDGHYVSLHPSEYRVLRWRDPLEFSPATLPATHVSPSEVC